MNEYEQALGGAPGDPEPLCSCVAYIAGRAALVGDAPPPNNEVKALRAGIYGVGENGSAAGLEWEGDYNSPEMLAAINERKGRPIWIAVITPPPTPRAPITGSGIDF